MLAFFKTFASLIYHNKILNAVYTEDTSEMKCQFHHNCFEEYFIQLKGETISKIYFSINVFTINL